MPNYPNPGLPTVNSILRTTTVPAGPVLNNPITMGGGGNRQLPTPPKPNDPTKLIGDIRDAYGPDALMNATNDIFNQINQSPAMRAMMQQILMGQNAGMGALAGQQGRTGMSQTGIGQARGTLQRSSGAYQQAQIQGDAYRQASNMARENMALEAGVLSDWDRAINPGMYRPWELQESSQEHQAYMAKLTHLYGRDMAELIAKLSKDEGIDIGKILEALGGTLPFVM